MSTPRRSLAPFWLTLGFTAGLAFGWAAFHDETPRAVAAPVAPKTAPAAPDRVEIPVNADTLRAVEQTFERWGGYAIWENEVTEFAVWDAQHQRHTDFYEVRRHDGKFFFRSLAALTRPLIDHGVMATMPIAFTEPQWMRDQFYQENPDYNPSAVLRVALRPRPPERSSADRPRSRSETTTPKSETSKTDAATPMGTR